MAVAYLEFGSSVNPIPTRGADYAHHITACPSGFENLMASLHIMWFHVQLTQKILNGIYQPAALSAMRKLSAETSTGINHGLLSYIDADSDQSNGLLEREQK